MNLIDKIRLSFDQIRFINNQIQKISSILKTSAEFYVGSVNQTVNHSRTRKNNNFIENDENNIKQKFKDFNYNESNFFIFPRQTKYNDENYDVINPPHFLTLSDNEEKSIKHKQQKSLNNNQF